MEPVEAHRWRRRNGGPHETEPMVAELVSFASRLDDSAILRTIDERIPQYRAVPGLIQKIYIHDPQTLDYGGIYVWESEAALRAFRSSGLARTLAAAYDTEGEPLVRRFEVISIL